MTPVVKLSEAAFQRQVVDLARLCGWKVQHQTISYRSAPGWPDLALCRGPRLVMAELKSTTGVLSAAQRDWLDALDAVPGVEAYVWRPNSWDEVQAVLARPRLAPAAASTPHSSVKVGSGPAVSAASPVLRGSRPPDGGAT